MVDWKAKQSMANKIVPSFYPKDVYIQIPRTHEYVMFHG